MKIYVDLELEKHYTNRFSNTSAHVFTLSNSDYIDVTNDVKLIDYVNSTSSELVIITNASPKENSTSVFIQNGDIKIEFPSGDYELKTIPLNGVVYLDAHNTATQTYAVVDTPQDVTFSDVSASNGVTLTGGNTINIPSDGFYMITMEPQIMTSSGSNKRYDFWFELNGVAIPNSRMFATDDNGEGNSICVMLKNNFTSGDAIVVKTMANSLTVSLAAEAASGAIPAIPSSKIFVIKH